MPFDEFVRIFAMVATPIAAWVGLGLSLYNIWQGRAKRRVEVSLGSVGSARLDGTSRRVIIIRFINARGPVVVIEQVGFECADGKHVVKFRVRPSEELPTTVPPGYSAKYYYDLETWREAVQEGEPMPVRAYCKDATGRYYKTPLNQEIRSALRIPPKGSIPAL